MEKKLKVEKKDDRREEEEWERKIEKEKRYNEMQKGER